MNLRQVREAGADSQSSESYLARSDINKYMDTKTKGITTPGDIKDYLAQKARQRITKTRQSGFRDLIVDGD